MRNRRAVDRDHRPLAARTHLVQRARKKLLADPGFAEQEHRDLAARRLLHHFECAAKTGRASDHVRRQTVQIPDRRAQLRHLGLQAEQLFGDRIRSEHAHEFGRVVPLLDRLADDAAGLITLADAIDFLVEDLAPHEGRREATGISDLRPAHGLGLNPVVTQMRLAFPRILPAEFAVEVPALAVQFETDRRDADDAFEGVQLRPGHEGFNVAAVGGTGADQLGVAHAGGIAHAHQKAARTGHAEGVDELLAQRGLGFGVHQQHAVLMQPDLARTRTETDLRTQIAVLRACLALEPGHRLALLVVGHFYTDPPAFVLM